MIAKIKRDVIIRYEKDLPGENVFIFIGSKNNMLTANLEVYEIIKLIKECNDKNEILGRLCEKYEANSKEEILEGLNYTLEYLMDKEVIE